MLQLLDVNASGAGGQVFVTNLAGEGQEILLEETSLVLSEGQSEQICYVQYQDDVPQPVHACSTAGDEELTSLTWLQKNDLLQSTTAQF